MAEVARVYRNHRRRVSAKQTSRHERIRKKVKKFELFHFSFSENNMEYMEEINICSFEYNKNVFKPTRNFLGEN